MRYRGRRLKLICDVHDAIQNEAREIERATQYLELAPNASWCAREIAHLAEAASTMGCAMEEGLREKNETIEELEKQLAVAVAELEEQLAAANEYITDLEADLINLQEVNDVQH